MLFFLRYVLLLFSMLFLQIFVLKHIEIANGSQFFILPLFLMILPFQINVFVLMLVGFGTGIIVDSFSNTIGLNASSLVLVAYLRPIIFNYFPPREGYDPLKLPTIPHMGWWWFSKTYMILLLLHCLWFFAMEIFRFSDGVLIMRNTLYSLLPSFFAALVINLFSKRPKA